MPGAGAMVSGGALSSDAWSFDLSRAGNLVPGDRFALRVAQPLRVRSGGYAMSLPNSYDYGTLTVGYGAQTYSLAPTGREIDLEAAYLMPLLGGAGSLGANLFVRHEPGHYEMAPTDYGAAARFSLRF